MSSKAPPDCLNTWRRLGRLDLNEVQKNSPIDLSQDLVYHEYKSKNGHFYGQKKVSSKGAFGLFKGKGV